MTRYFLSYKPKNGRPENFTAFDSLMARNLFILTAESWMTVLKVWEEDKSDLEMTGDLVDRLLAALPEVRERIAEEEARRS